jgi:hypothetical protein
MQQRLAVRILRNRSRRGYAPWQFAIGHLCDEGAAAGLVQQFDRSSLRPLLTLTDLHPHTLAFRQLIQSTSFKGRGMNEDVFTTYIVNRA